ncbi:hypothetical protein J2T17_007479 [Paenibacillus mucilaginosus]|uniref:hypothetical protein n=1 Tax=Paenibacillus mucilaginosus TaxID=61624 RepID=UPI003D19D14F
MSELKPQHIKIGTKYDTIFQQIIEHNKANRIRPNTKTALLEKWILQHWLSGEYPVFTLEVGNKKVYFVTEEEKNAAATQFEEYRKNGLSIDEQLISFVVSAHRGFNLD